MATTQLNDVLQHLRRTAHLRDHDDMPDGALLGCFVAERDEAAFETLVRRHGGMVMGVCRRVVGNHEDAQDAFQATFLVLARKAASVAPSDLVGNWLYGVAYRTALEARGKLLRRRTREKQVSDMPHPAVECNHEERELLRLLDLELSRLPDKYRVPIVLCELEGRSRKEAAAHLRLPEGTLSSRLATARKTLAGRLARQGVALSVGALTALLAQQAAEAALPHALATTTAQAVLTSSTSAQATIIAEGVLKTMLLTKLKTLASWAAACILLAGCLALAWHNLPAADVNAAPPVAFVHDDAPPPAPPQENGAPPARQDNKRVEPKRDAKAFTQIHVKMGKALIRQTDKNAVEVKADPLFAQMAVTSIENGILTLKAPNPSIEFIVEVKELTSLKVEGVSEVTVKDLKTKRLEVTLDVVARVVVSGTAQEQIIMVKGGAAQFDGAACQGKEATVTVSGAGKAIVNVTDKLKVSIPSAGTVEYLGSPKIDETVSIAGRLSQRAAANAKEQPGKKEPDKQEPKKEAKEEPLKPGSVKITAKVDGFTQGTMFNTQKYPFKYTNSSRLDADQLKSLAKEGDVSETTAKALLSAALWPGMDDKLEKVKLKSDGKKISGEAEIAHKYGKQGTHTLKFRVEGTIDAGKLTLRAVEPVVSGTWDYGGGSIKLTGKVDIEFAIVP